MDYFSIYSRLFDRYSLQLIELAAGWIRTEDLWWWRKQSLNRQLCCHNYSTINQICFKVFSRFIVNDDKDKNLEITFGAFSCTFSRVYNRHLFLVFSNKHHYNFYNKYIQYTVPGFEPTTFGTWVSSHHH